MYIAFALKLVLVPSLLAGITLAGRRWGASVAGWLAGFPVVAGPILFFIAHEQGPVFGAGAAFGTFLGIPAVLAFNLGYSWSAMRMSWPVSLVSGLLVYFAAIGLLSSVALSLSAAIPLIVGILILAPRLFPKVTIAFAPTSAPPSSEIFLRMLVGALLVLAVTYFAANLGPRLSGLFAMFPVISIVLAVFSHRYMGEEFAIRLLRGVVLGWYAFAMFCLALVWNLPAYGVGFAFLIAVFGAAVVQIVSRKFIRHT